MSGALARRGGDTRDRKTQVIAIDVAGRVPPHNDDAEAAVLSAVLTESRVLDGLQHILPNGEPFYADAHRRIYDVALELHGKGQPVDIQTVAEVFKQRDRLQAIGGIAYLVRLVDATPSVANVEAHARIVREKWRVRRIIEAQQLGAAEGYCDYGEAQEYLDTCVGRLTKVADDNPERRDATLLYDVMKSTIESYGSVASQGARCGLADIDERTGGMHDGELIIVAARPGMGKTSYVLKVATSVAETYVDPPTPDDPEQRGVMIFSLEMPKEQLAMRMLCAEARANVQAYRKGNMPSDVFDRAVATADRLAQLPVWIDDAPFITLAELRAKLRRQVHEFNRRWPDRLDVWKRRVGLVIVDYLQLMRGRDGITSREQEISEISRGLKAIAKEFQVPVIALSQLSRKCEERGGKDKRPILSDLRESGAIEQDADVVQFIYRPEYYITDKESPEARKLKGYAEVIVAKQRNGPTGRVPVTFIEEYTRFENRSRDAWRDTEDD